MWERFPPRMRRVIRTALDRAGERGSDQVTPADILRAIASDPQSAGTFILERAGVAIEPLLQAIATDPAAPLPYASRLSDESLRLLQDATRHADNHRDRQVGTEHVILALANLDGSDATSIRTVLHNAGLTRQRADDALREWRRTGMPRGRGARLRNAPSPIRWLGAMLHRGWGVYIGKSLGHPAFVKDPYPMYRRLREREPVRRDPIAPVWVLTRYADNLNLLRDPRFQKDPFAGERLPKEMREQLGVSVMGSARAALEMTSMLFLDPPQHTRVRSIFTKAFTPKRLESLRPKITAITNRLLDEVKNKGKFELLHDLAAPLPVTVIAELLGFPPEDYRQIKQWSDEMAEALGLAPSKQQAARAYQARQEIHDYFDALIERLRRAPGDNLLSALLALETQGEGLGPDELFSNSILLLAAGHETTTNLIGNGMLALLRNPDQLHALREHPDLIESAVEELLRYDPPVQWTSRVAGEDFEFGGQQLKRGEIVLGSVGAANRDPAVFAEPDKLDIRRSDNKHLSFGTGIHFCLGAALARMEAQIAISTMLERMPNLKLPAQKIRWRKGITFRGLHQLHLEF